MIAFKLHFKGWWISPRLFSII